MARDIWAISDTHFGHANILNFVGADGKPIRPQFADVSHMDEQLIDNWNSTIKQGDLVYHFGDVFFGSKERFEKLWPRLNGSKRLIVGNHDDVKYLSSGAFFQKVMMWRVFAEQRLIFSHVPLHESSLDRGNKGGMFNIHGHTHQHGSPPGPYYSVCVEKQQYKPVHIDTLASIAQKYFDNMAA